MKILVLESSGNKKGSSNMLGAEFIRGAEESGNKVTVFDVFRADIRTCIGCGHCGMNGPCVQKDDYENRLKPMIKDTDVLVFIMPVYYYNWPAQLKKVIDRFYSFTGELTQMHKKTVLLSAAWDDTDSVFEIVKAYYEKICDYMQFSDQGMVLAKGCGTPSITKSSQYLRDAYELGKKMK